MKEINQLDKLYNKFRVYMNKGNVMGLYDDDYKEISNIFHSIVKFELRIIDNLFDELILPDLIYEDNIDLFIDIDENIGWRRCKRKKRNIEIDKYKYSILLDDLKWSFINRLDNIDVLYNDKELIDLISKYSSGEDEKEIYTMYLNDRFLDLYELLEGNNEKID